MATLTKNNPHSAKTTASTQPAPVAITGMGFSCHAGEKSRSLISAILGQISGYELSKTYAIRLKDGSDDMPRVSPIDALAHQPAPQRIISMCATALGNAAATLPASIKPESVLIVIMVDPKHLCMAGNAVQQRVQSEMTNSVPRLEAANFRILTSEASSGTSALGTAIAELNSAQWQAVIFGGTDSLVSTETCLELSDENRLNTVKENEGIVPGEAAAFIVLQSTDNAVKNTSPALGYLRGMGVTAELNARDADIENTEGLSSAINLALTQASLKATDIQGVVHNLGAETVQSFEWYKTTQQIWPIKISEQQRLAIQMREIEQPDIPDDPIPKSLLTYLNMGEIGTATLPMQVAITLAWIEYDAHQARWGFPLRNNLLVCDTPEAPERGALIISKTLAAAI